MSYYKQELLIPDSVLKEEYRGENRNTVLQLIRSISIYDLAFGWSALQNQIGPLLVSETVWHSGLNLKQAFPIYLQNVFFKGNSESGYAKQSHLTILPFSHFFILHEKILDLW
jgi:hypothetical protein